MSPALDMPHDAEAEFPTRIDGNSLPGAYNIDGILVAHDGELEINAEVRVKDASIAIHHFGSNKTRIIEAQEPAAIAFVDTLAAELRNGASTREDRLREWKDQKEWATPDLPPIEYRDADGALQSTPALWMAFNASLQGLTDDDAGTSLADAYLLHRHYGSDGIRDLIPGHMERKKATG